MHANYSRNINIAQCTQVLKCLVVDHEYLAKDFNNRQEMQCKHTGGEWPY